MALSIYSLFKVDIRNLVQNKARLSKDFHLQPSEVDRMPFWEYEEFMNAAVAIVEDENKQQEEQNEQYSPDSYTKSANSMISKQQRNFKTPQMPKISMPKI